MRLRACAGGLLLAVTGCVGMPERVRIDVDGHSIEVRQNCTHTDAAVPEEERGSRAEQLPPPDGLCPR